MNCFVGIVASWTQSLCLRDLLFLFCVSQSSILVGNRRYVLLIEAPAHLSHFLKGPFFLSETVYLSLSALTSKDIVLVCINLNVQFPGPGTGVSSPLNRALVDLNWEVPVELILRMMEWLLETDLMLGSIIGRLTS